MEASGRNVEVELADGDAKAADTEVTEAKNSTDQGIKVRKQKSACPIWSHFAYV